MDTSREVMVTRPRARWGRTVGARPGLLRALGVVAVVWLSAYLVWRVGWSRRDANPWLWGALLVAELYALWSLVTFLWTGWTLPAVRRPLAHTPRTVDVFVCAYDEPVDLLRATLAGCAALTRPHATWVLDDAARGEVAELAEEYGAGYLIRPGNAGAQAGNLDAALPRTDGELLFVLAADQVPMPDALDAVAGWFEDPEVALVQTAHEVSGHESIERRRPGRHEQSVFDGVLQPGADRRGAAVWRGPAVMLRRSALEDIGGFATGTGAEDLHTTLRLQAAGHRSHFHDEVLVQGLARHGLSTELRRRERRARGTFAILTTPESPLRPSGLRPAQRVSHLAGVTGLLAGPVRLLALAVLAAVLFTGELPMTPAPAALLGLWLPALVLSLAAASALGRGYQTLADTTHVELLTAQLHLRALPFALRREASEAPVAPMRDVDLGGLSALRRFALLDLLAAALALGLAWRVLGETGLAPAGGDLPGVLAVAVPLLGLLELRRVVRTLRIVASRRELRRTHRVPVAGLAEVRRAGAAGASAPVTAKLLDLSPSGAGLLAPEAFEVGEALTLTLLARESAARGVTHVHAQVARVQPRDGGLWTVGVQLTENSEDVQRRIAELCASHAPMWRLRGAPERRRAPGARRAA